MDEEGEPPHSGDLLRSTFVDEVPSKTADRLREERGDLHFQLHESHARTRSTEEELCRAQMDLATRTGELEELLEVHSELSMHADELEHRVGELETQKAELDGQHNEDALALSTALANTDDGGGGLAAAASVSPNAAPGREAAAEEEIAALKARLAALQVLNDELAAEALELRDAIKGEQEARLAAQQKAKVKAQQAAKAEEATARLAAEKNKLTETVETEYAQLPVRLQQMQAELERTRISANMARAEAERAMSMAVCTEAAPSLFDDLPMCTDADAGAGAEAQLKDANSRVTELEVSMRELQSKWDAHQLESQKEE
jgi:hypothetical protein